MSSRRQLQESIPRPIEEDDNTMIHEVTGDILLTEAEAIAHGIAPNDHFDSGLALSLREQRPALYKDFRHYLHTNHPKPGELWVWAGSGAKRIINLFTQEPAPNEHAKPGRATYANLNHCLRELQKVIIAEGIKSVALPRLATGVGGLEWDQVLPVIKADFGLLKIPIFIYTHFQKGVKAVEKAG